MSYNALVVQVLLSSPSDLSTTHRNVILKQTRAWNADHGRVYGIHFSLVDWRDNAAAAAGEYAQAVLNEQLVDESDAGLVVFTDRMGTPTPHHPSGTAEEIHQLLERGRDVAVLDNCTPRPEPTDPESTEQKKALRAYVQSLYPVALVKSFDGDDALRREVDLVLTFLARKHRREADAGLRHEALPSETEPSIESVAAEEEVAAAGVWPRLEVSESATVDRRGRPKVKRKWRVVLENTSSEPVTDVKVRFEDGKGTETQDFDLGRTSGVFAQVLAPGGTVERPLFQAWGSPEQALCIVSWKDSAGVERETRSSLRTR
jgi:hypothetical protein